MKYMILVGLVAALPLTFPSARADTGSGVIRNIETTTVAVKPDGSTVTVHRQLNPQELEDYARAHGLVVAPPTTSGECTGGSGSQGPNPPPDDQYPGEPPPGTEPPDVNQSTQSRTYTDGWTLFSTFGRSVTPDGHGGVTDGDWRNVSKGYTPPGNHANDAPCIPVDAD